MDKTTTQSAAIQLPNNAFNLTILFKFTVM